MLRKFLLLVLALSLMVTLFIGCNASSTTKEATKATIKPTTSADSGMVGNMYKAGLPVVKDKQTFKIMCMRPPSSKVDVSQKDITKQLEEETNVKIEWDEIIQTAFSEKVNITFASGQLPDAILGGVSVSTVLNNRPVIHPLNDLLNQWAPNIIAAAKTHSRYLSTITYPDGKIYSIGLLQVNPHAELADRMVINKVWLDKLELKVPETTADFEAVLQAFKTKDPNGNGKADEIPLGFAQKAVLTTSINSLFGSFGTLENPIHVNVKDGKVIFAPSETGFYEALQYLRKLNNSGLLDVEGFTQNDQQYQAKAKSGIYGAFISNIPSNYLGPLDKDYITIKPLKGPKGDQLWNINQNAAAVPGLAQNNFMITKNCKNPDILVRWIDYWNSSLDMKNTINYGKLGETWQKTDGGKWATKTDSVPQGMTYAEQRQSTSFWVTAPLVYSRQELDMYTSDARTARGIEDMKTYSAFWPKQHVSTQFIMEDTEVKEQIVLSADIDPYVAGFIAKSVTNGITDKEWSDHLTKLKALNVDKYVALYQKYFDRQK